MISGINYANYYKVAQMTHSLNGFIRQAMITKAQINSTASMSSLASNYIGGKVDILA